MILSPLDVRSITARAHFEGVKGIGWTGEPVGVVHPVGHGHRGHFADTGGASIPCQYLSVQWEVGGDFPDIHDIVTKSEGNVGSAGWRGCHRELARLHLVVNSSEFDYC